MKIRKVEKKKRTVYIGCLQSQMLIQNQIVAVMYLEETLFYQYI